MSRFNLDMPELEKNKDEVLKILKEGGEKAKARTEAKMLIVRKKIGVIPA